MRTFFQKLRVHLIALPLVSWGVVVVLCVSGLSLSGYGIWQIVVAASVSSSSNSGSEVMQICEPPERKRIVVDVSGAVITPGVYGVLQGDRIADAVAAAGGFSQLADKTLVSKQLNMASLLVDGQKVHIPIEGEEKLINEPVTSGTDSSGTEGQKLSINTASQKSLENLTGIGEKRAEDIVAGRPYMVLDDLVTKEIVTASMYEKIKEDIQL